MEFVAVRALLAPKHHSRKGYTGPQASTAYLNELKVKVIYVEGLPDDADVDTVALEKSKASATEEFISFVDVDKICGHRPKGYGDYVSNHVK
jgi:hypothetical protein